MRDSVIVRDPEILGGTPVFAGTRVPVATLIDYLAGGDSIDEFLDGFPSVSREQVIAYLIQRTPPGSVTRVGRHPADGA